MKSLNLVIKIPLKFKGRIKYLSRLFAISTLIDIVIEFVYNLYVYNYYIYNLGKTQI